MWLGVTRYINPKARLAPGVSWLRASIVRTILRVAPGTALESSKIAAETFNIWVP